MTFYCVPKRVFVPKKKCIHQDETVEESEVYFKKKNSRDGKNTLWKPLFADTPELVISIVPKNKGRKGQPIEKEIALC